MFLKYFLCCVWRRFFFMNLNWTVVLDFSPVVRFDMSYITFLPAPLRPLAGPDLWHFYGFLHVHIHWNPKSDCDIIKTGIFLFNYSDEFSRCPLFKIIFFMLECTVFIFYTKNNRTCVCVPLYQTKWFLWVTAFW